MSSTGDDAIEIPIEIKLEDIKQLREVKKDVEQVEKKVKKIKDTTSQQAVPTLETEERGGIFGGGKDVKLKKPKDKTSAQPITRENEFNKQRDIVKDLQKKVGQQQSAFNEMFGLIPFTGGGAGLARFAFKFVPFIGTALIAKGFVDQVIQELIRDGGFFDRRLLIKIERQFLKLTGRKEAAEFSRGKKTLRVTSSPALRGPTTAIFNTQSQVKRGLPLLAENQESLAKGVLT